MRTVSSLAALSALASTALAATPVVTAQGNAFFSNGKRFFMRGIDYQPGGSSDAVDPIANPTTCMRDIQYFKQLGVNTIRVYTVDNTANHDECMNALSAAGIYLALDVNNGLYSINRANPAPSYNAVYLQSIFATIDAFAGYNNTLLFFSGNEVINNATNSDCAPYVKAVGRDMKNYIAARGYRHIPVGYSAADVTENRYQTAVYMNCGPDSMARSDFFAFNDYSWCDPSSFTTSGWDVKVQTYANYSLPLFLSEFGCITNPPRDFGEVAALYNTEMTGTYSGGLVYEYSEESSNPGYGVVNIASDTSASPKQPEFSNLAGMFSANPAPTNAAYSSSLPYFSACPTTNSNWQMGSFTSFLLPALPTGAMTYMSKGAGKGPGLTGAGSQNSGSENVAAVDASGTTTFGYTTPTGTAATGTTGNAAPSIRPIEVGWGPIVSLAAFALSAVFGAALL